MQNGKKLLNYEHKELYEKENIFMSNNSTNELFAEVFGLPTTNTLSQSISQRNAGLCPYLNGPCQKSTYIDREGIRRPMGVCSMFHNGDQVAITCPHRLKEQGVMIEAAASFCFPDASISDVIAIPEMPLKTSQGRKVGNLDYVLALKGKDDKVVDFAGLEIQTVYFSGNSIKEMFQKYLEHQKEGVAASPKQTGNQRPDYRSSHKKRLLPQMIEKGPIFSAWKKKFCVAIHNNFYDHLCRSVNFEVVEKEKADFAWVVLDYSKTEGDQMPLELSKMVYCSFDSVLKAFLLSPDDIPSIASFVSAIEEKLRRLPLIHKAHSNVQEVVIEAE